MVWGFNDEPVLVLLCKLSPLFIVTRQTAVGSASALARFRQGRLISSPVLASTTAFTSGREI